MRQEIICGDCREIMPVLKPSPTVIITDPVWPNPIDCLVGADRPYELFSEFCSVLPETVKRIAIILGCDSDPRILAPIPLPFFRVCALEYSVPSKVGRLLKTGDTAYLFGPPPKVKLGQRVIPGRCVDRNHIWKETNHPCPRKISHMQWLVKWWTEDEDVVCDPFCGSGTTILACKEAGLRATGIEIDPAHCKESRDRLKQGVLSFV